MLCIWFYSLRSRAASIGEKRFSPLKLAKPDFIHLFASLNRRWYEKRMRKIILLLAIFLSAQASFALDKKHEITPEIMLDNADAMRALTFAALQYTYHINEEFWVGVDGLYGRTVVDGGSGLVVGDGETMWGVAPIFYWNLPALLGASKEKPEGAEAHLYTSFGAGYLRIGDQNEPYGVFGGGMLWQSGLGWLGARVDVKGIFYMLENTNGSDFNSDFALSVGPAFIF
jgi:hypothetical protein